MAANQAKTANELQKHMTATYFTLRMGIILIASTLPLILWFGGLALGIPLKDSMSAYYHAERTILRDVFIGVLCATGAFLYLYKGFGKRENYALNSAGFLIVCVAFIPTAIRPPAGAQVAAADPFTAHGVAAVLFFAAIAYVCIFEASRTLELMNDKVMAKRYARLYKLAGIAMITAPLTAYVLTLLARRPEGDNPYVFFVEFVGVWIFAGYWLLKSREIAHTDAERRVAEGTVQANAAGELVDAAAPRQVASAHGQPQGAPA